MFEETGITAEEFAERRQRLAEKMPPSSIALLGGGIEKCRNGDAEYPFRQESNFYYLTGFSEPEALLALLKKQDGKMEFILFCRPRVPEEEIWVGKRAGQEGALKEYGADRAYSIKDLASIMPGLLENNKRIPEVDLLAIIHEFRLMKSAAEIELMRKAAVISADAHIRLMETCQPDQKEYQLEALFIYDCFQKGCRTMAYPPIVGGGDNACTLHYTQNDKPLPSGELVLVDAGAEYKYYAADITRTFPINGRFTKDQKAIYEWVLKAQLAAIEQVRPGTVWDKIQETIIAIMVEGLVSLGILKGSVESLIEQKAYRKFYMHSSGHWLGLDVHDVGEYKINEKYRTLEPGMVLTVEPGIYISPGESSVDKRWWGIGIRIEDDVLVTKTGHEVLTKSVPKTVAEIEKRMNSKNK